MLLDNFRPLISFYAGSNFIDVKGNVVSVNDRLCQSMYYGGGKTAYTANGHSFKGHYKHFNYNPTTSTNNYKNEQSLYGWQGVVSSNSTNGNTMTEDNGHYRRNGFILFIGTGNTPVETSDYKLENAVELNIISASCVHNADETTIITRTFQNNTGEEVIIKEVGLYMFCSQTSNDTYKNEKYYVPVIMLGRKVLNTPIIIANNESYTFTYKIDMSKISFAEADY